MEASQYMDLSLKVGTYAASAGRTKLGSTTETAKDTALVYNLLRIRTWLFFLSG